MPFSALLHVESHVLKGGGVGSRTPQTTGSRKRTTQTDVGQPVLGERRTRGRVAKKLHELLSDGRL